MYTGQLISYMIQRYIMRVCYSGQHSPTPRSMDTDRISACYQYKTDMKTQWLTVLFHLKLSFYCNHSLSPQLLPPMLIMIIISKKLVWGYKRSRKWLRYVSVNEFAMYARKCLYMTIAFMSFHRNYIDDYWRYYEIVWNLNWLHVILKVCTIATNYMLSGIF